MLAGAVETVESYFVNSVSGSDDMGVESAGSRDLGDSLATIVSSCVPGLPLSTGDIRLSASSDSCSHKEDDHEKSFALKMLLILTKKSEEEFQPYFGGLASLGVSLEKVYTRVQQSRNLALCKNAIYESNSIRSVFSTSSSSSMKVHRVSWGSQDNGRINHEWQTMWTLYLNHLLYDQPIITCRSHVQMGMQFDTNERQSEVLVGEDCLFEVHNDIYHTTNQNSDDANSSKSGQTSSNNKCILIIGSAMAKNVFFLAALLSNWHILVRHACEVKMISTSATPSSLAVSEQHGVALSWFIGTMLTQQVRVLVRCALAGEGQMMTFVPFQTSLGSLNYSALTAMDMHSFVSAVIPRTVEICCDDDMTAVWRLVLASTRKLPSLLQNVCSCDNGTTEALLMAVFMVCGSQCFALRRKRGSKEDEKMTLVLRKEWTLSSEHLQCLFGDASFESQQRIVRYNQNYASYDLQKARLSSSFEIASRENEGLTEASFAMKESKQDIANGDVNSILMRYLYRHVSFEEEQSVSRQVQSQEVQTLEALFLLTTVASLLSMPQTNTSSTNCWVLIDTICSVFLQQMIRESDREQQTMLYLEILFTLILAEIECTEREMQKETISGKIYVHPHRPLLRALSARWDNNLANSNSNDGELLAEAEAMQCTAAAMELLYRNASNTDGRALLSRIHSL